MARASLEPPFPDDHTAVGHERTPRWLPPAVLGTTLVLLGVRILYTYFSAFALDELQHLHAAYLVARGQRPYVDFFEHHTPLFYFLGSLVMPEHPTSATVVAYRFAALGARLATIAILAAWAHRTRGRTAAITVAVLAFGDFAGFAYGAHGYLDAYAAPVLAGAAFALSRGDALTAGALLATAVLITQKLGICAPAVAAVALGWLTQPETRGGMAWRRLVRLAGGGLLVLATVGVWLGADGLLAMDRDALLLNLSWKARHRPVKELAFLVLSGGHTYGLGIVMAGTAAWRILRRRVIASDDVGALFLLAAAAGVAILPVVWQEYFIATLPFAIFVAGITLAGWWDDRAIDGRGVVAAASVAICALALGRFVAPLLEPSAPAFTWTWLLATLLLTAVATRVAWTALPARSPVGAIACLTLWIGYPVLQQLEWSTFNFNTAQREKIDYVLETTGADEPLLDSYSGYGVFRPHAYRYWFLHDEVQLMVPPGQLRDDLLAVLETTRPTLVVVDEWSGSLPAPVRDYVARHYEATPYRDIKRRVAP